MRNYGLSKHAFGDGREETIDLEAILREIRRESAAREICAPLPPQRPGRIRRMLAWLRGRTGAS